MSLRINGYNDIFVTDRTKVRVCDLKEFDFFEHLGCLFRVTLETKERIFYMRLIDYSVEYEFGKKSQRFVYKVLLN